MEIQKGNCDVRSNEDKSLMWNRIFQSNEQKNSAARNPGEVDLVMSMQELSHVVPDSMALTEERFAMLCFVTKIKRTISQSCIVPFLFNKLVRRLSSEGSGEKKLLHIVVPVKYKGTVKY
jgi:hypothetical protein